MTVAALVAAACSSVSPVETERVDGIPSSESVDETTSGNSGAEPDVTTPVAPDTADTTPADTTPTDTTQTTSPGETEFVLPTRDAATGLDDELFPALGAPDLDVISYDVRLDIEPDGSAFDAVVIVVADVTLGVGQLSLDAGPFEIDEVLIDSSQAAFDHDDGELLIELPTERPVRVKAEIAYSASPETLDSAFGFGSGWFTTADGAYVLNEPDGAHLWMPSNDHPSDKATWRFEITVDSESVGVANGDLIQKGSADEPWIWEMTDPMSTYLVQLAIGDYTIIEQDEILSIDGSNISLTNAAISDVAETMQVFFDETAGQVAFFEELFGPYPFDQYGLAFLDSSPGLAMETQGRSLFAVDDFRQGDVGYLQHLLLAHELTHQWFGDAVSPATWSDIWLNESFATYGQWLWLEEVGLGSVTSSAETGLALRQDGQHSTGDPSRETMFGIESYDGGATVVHALRLTIGDDEFFELLQRWLAENNGTSQTTATFIDLAQEVSGQDLTEFFDEWLYAIDLPDELPG
jgi:aminopeptidase N